MISKDHVLTEYSFWEIIDSLATNSDHQLSSCREDGKAASLAYLFYKGYKQALRDMMDKYEDHRSFMGDLDPEEHVVQKMFELTDDQTEKLYELLNSFWEEKYTKK